MFRILPSLLLFALPGLLAGQKFPEHSEKSPINEGKAILLNLGTGFDIPAADLADRFGFNQSVSAGIDWISAGNFIFGAEGQFYFGNRVNDDPLEILRTSDGGIIGNNRLFASVVFRQRGLYTGAHAGKLFVVGKNRQGIRLTLGAGMLRHWIRVQDDSQSLTQITGEYHKGYDRLTGGLALNQFIGWEHLGWNRRANWTVGFVFNEGFTQTLRDWDYSSMKKLDGKRFDFRYGIRVGWTLPFYLQGAEKIYY